jgi:hypothetical protein
MQVFRNLAKNFGGVSGVTDFFYILYTFEQMLLSIYQNQSH